MYDIIEYLRSRFVPGGGENKQKMKFSLEEGRRGIDRARDRTRNTPDNENSKLTH
jgi:hypothetical protein